MRDVLLWLDFNFGTASLGVSLGSRIGTQTMLDCVWLEEELVPGCLRLSSQQWLRIKEMDLWPALFAEPVQRELPSRMCLTSIWPYG